MVSVSIVMLVVLSACGDDDAFSASTAGVSTTTAAPSTSEGQEPTTTSPSATTTEAPETTETTESTTTIPGASARSFCEVDAEGRTIDPYRGTPESMEADVARARELGTEFLATAPPEIEADLNVIIPIFLDVLDYVESTGFDESAVDFGFIQSEFYGFDEAQEAGAAIDEWVDANC